MSRILNLPYTRFVCQVSNGGTRSKSSFLSMMAENEKYLQNCEWHESEAEANEVAIPVNNVFFPEGYINDAYDAYIRGGRANVNGADTFEGYAGMVAYRFKLPEAYKAEGSEAMLESLSLIVSRDRYLRAGVRVVAVVSDADSPSKEWSVVRGEGSPFGTSSIIPKSQTLGLRSKGFLNQAETEYLVDTRAEEGMLTVDLTGIDATKHSYVFVYLTLEDYQNRWIQLNEKNKREYWIEGAAMLVGQSNAFTFSADVEGDSDAGEWTVIQQGGESPRFISMPTFIDAFSASICEVENKDGYKTKSGIPSVWKARHSADSDISSREIDAAELYGTSIFYDTAFQVCSATCIAGIPSSQAFMRLIDASGVVLQPDSDGLANNVAFGRVLVPSSEDYHVNLTVDNSRGVKKYSVWDGVPACDLDGVKIVPRFESNSSGGNYFYPYPQAGLSAQFSNRDGGLTTSFLYRDENEPGIAYSADNNERTRTKSLSTIAYNPSYLIVSSMAVLATKCGANLMLRATENVPNTGIKVRFAIWLTRGAQWNNALSILNFGLMHRTKGLVRNLDVGKTLRVQTLPDGVNNEYVRKSPDVGGFDVECIGVTDEVSAGMSAGEGLNVELSTQVEAGDVLVIVPVPVGIAGEDNGYYFGLQADPFSATVLDNVSPQSKTSRVWARRPHNLGWFPEVSIKNK